MYFNINLNFSKFNKRCICWWVKNIFAYHFTLVHYDCFAHTQIHFQFSYLENCSKTDVTFQNTIKILKICLRADVSRFIANSFLYIEWKIGKKGSHCLNKREVNQKISKQCIHNTCSINSWFYNKGSSV